MIMFYLDNEADFMKSFYRAFLAKSKVDLLAPIDQPVKVWTTSDNNIQLDAVNKFVMIDGRSIFRFDFLWIENIDRFLWVEVKPGRYMNQGIIDLSWKVEGERINLFLVPTLTFPIWENMTGDFAGG